MSFRLQKNSYGKSDIRLTRLFRRADGSFDICQMEVNVRLSGEFDAAYLQADNRKVIATDSIKNTVYVLARRSEFDCCESFGHLLAEHFLRTYAHVAEAGVEIAAIPYARITVDGQPHPHAFEGSTTERRTFSIALQRGAQPMLRQGIDGLIVLKATASEWTNFLTDEYRTLPDASERILATVVQATWNLPDRPADYSATHAAARSALIKTFATHYSLGVQQTLFEMGKAALAAVPEATRISLTLPNKHHMPVNLAPFGLDNPHMVFHPADEPYGLICGTIERE